MESAFGKSKENKKSTMYAFRKEESMAKTTTTKKSSTTSSKKKDDRFKSPLVTGEGTPEQKRKNLVEQIAGKGKSKAKEVPTLTDYLAPYEKEYIEKVLQQVNGNLVQASLILDVARNTLKAKIKKHKIKLPK
jgi:DNA-binding NtrC family response regulator